MASLHAQSKHAGGAAMTTQQVFKSEESRDAIRTRYNQILSVFPFQKRYVETTFGRTFILESGDAKSPPLVLLHGSCSNSAFWFGEISALSGIFHVLAVDILGEAGNSAENRLDLDSEDYADWLAEVFDACAIEKPVVIGNSLGSWMALRFATKYPERVSRLILIAPAGLSGINVEFLERAKRMSQQKEPITMDPSVAQGVELPKEVEEFIILIFQGYNPITVALPIFTDEQIKRLTMPLLFVAGEADVMLDTAVAAQRLGQLTPDAEIHLLPGAGHMIINALAYVFPFLAKGRT
jgi:pimeloyl-ACP methyl ester carboxylesterase